MIIKKNFHRVNDNMRMVSRFQAPCPDTYRGKYRTVDYPGIDLGEKYANDIREICLKARSNGRSICAFIGESLQSCGGQIIPPQNYLRNVYK